MKKLLFCLLTFILILPFCVGCGNSPDATGTGSGTEAVSPEAVNASLEATGACEPIEDTIKFYRDDLGFSHLTGQIVNNTGRTCSLVEFSVNFMDKDWNVLESTFTSSGKLDPGQKWNFDAMGTSENIMHYETYDLSWMYD